MTKKIEELQQPKKEYSPEVIEFFKEISEELRVLGVSIQAQLEDAEKELAQSRSLGEDI